MMVPQTWVQMNRVGHNVIIKTVGSLARLTADLAVPALEFLSELLAKARVLLLFRMLLPMLVGQLRTQAS